MTGRSPRIAVLGLGEAGGAIGRDLIGAGADVRGFDPRVEAPAGMQQRTSDADAVRDAELVLSLTTAHDAMPALREALPALRPGTLWADLNTAAPRLKAELAGRAEPAGVAVVDVALMATVAGRGLHTPMLAAGAEAARLAADLAQYGARVEIQPGPVGAAISRKLLRSVFYKGLAAAVIEALAGARAAGCEEWLSDNIATELAALDETALDRLVSGTHRHAARRYDEMAAAADQLADLGVQPRIAAATRDALRAIVEGASAVSVSFSRVEP